MRKRKVLKREKKNRVTLMKNQGRKKKNLMAKGKKRTMKKMEDLEFIQREKKKHQRTLTKNRGREKNLLTKGKVRVMKRRKGLKVIQRKKKDQEVTQKVMIKKEKRKKKK